MFFINPFIWGSRGAWSSLWFLHLEDTEQQMNISGRNPHFFSPLCSLTWLWSFEIYDLRFDFPATDFQLLIWWRAIQHASGWPHIQNLMWPPQCLSAQSIMQAQSIRQCGMLSICSLWCSWAVERDFSLITFMSVLFQDESHFLKNIKTARCRAAMPLLKVCAKPRVASSQSRIGFCILGSGTNSSIPWLSWWKAKELHWFLEQNLSLRFSWWLLCRWLSVLSNKSSLKHPVAVTVGTTALISVSQHTKGVEMLHTKNVVLCY